MRAFLYGLALQWRLDLRSKTMLISCYLVPLLFFFFIGGIFTSINPESRYTLIQSMTVFGVSMGALIGLPPPLVEIYGSDIQKVYKANGVPLYLGVVTHFISAFIHLLIMCAIIYFVAPITFDATPPADLPAYFGSLALFIATSLSVGCVLGLLVKNMSKLTMISQVIFLPSIMLSGIMFPVSMLPKELAYFGKVFPATLGFELMTNDISNPVLYIPLILLFVIAALLCGYVLSTRVKK